MDGFAEGYFVGFSVGYFMGDSVVCLEGDFVGASDGISDLLKEFLLGFSWI